jgi:hypothetical protein
MTEAEEHSCRTMPGGLGPTPDTRFKKPPALSTEIRRQVRRALIRSRLDVVE